MAGWVFLRSNRWTRVRNIYTWRRDREEHEKGKTDIERGGGGERGERPLSLFQPPSSRNIRSRLTRTHKNFRLFDRVWPAAVYFIAAVPSPSTPFSDPV